VRVLADSYSRRGLFFFNFQAFSLLFPPSQRGARPLLSRRSHCAARARSLSPLYPVTADEKSPFHSRMNARGRCGGTIEVARIHKRRREAKPTMDREISTRIVSIAVGPQSHLGVTCPARRGLPRVPLPPPTVRCPRAEVTMGPHRYAIDTHGVLTSTRRRERLYCRRVCLIRARVTRLKWSATHSGKIAAGDRGIENGLEREREIL